MKVQYPISFPENFRFSVKTNPKWKSKDILIAIAALKKEVIAAGIRRSELITNVHMTAHGKRHGASMDPTAAQLIFRYNECRYSFIIDKYFRTADNVWALSQALAHWRKFKQEKIFVEMEKVN